ncbi:hypothetical protein PHYC_02975 [Phycisphaerales bacterium]|nr:hypothetical protein PHYC_02975 [Phycisphaerales bacterium]
MLNARNNILAGAFVLLGLLLAVWVSFLLSDRSAFESTTRFIVRFPIASGASGLRRGSSVLLGGQPIGRVLLVDFQRGEGDRPLNVDVQVEVRADLALHENARILLEKPLLGSLSSINITDPGAGPAPRIAPAAIMPGMTAPPSFLADAGFGPEQSAQIKETIASIDATTKRLATLVEQNGSRIDTGVEDAQKMLADLRARLAEWSARIDSTTASLDKAAGRLEPILAKAEQGIDDAKGAIASIRSLVDENRSRIDTIVKNIESASTKFDKETVDSVNQALRDGRDALGTFSDAVSRVSALVGEETPNMRRTLANLRLMSDQLKLTAIEVRSQPWRLLHQPTTKEFSAQVLYDATRSYAEAASDLRAASEAMQAAAAITAARGADAPDLAQLTDKLNEAIAKYRQAETYLLDKLIEAEQK